MSDNDLQTLLGTGIQAARNGNKLVARRIFEQVLELDDRNELAWMWMASVVDTARERRICLENVLEINPNNERAIQALAKLGGPKEAKPKAEPRKPPSRAPKPQAKAEGATAEEEIDLEARLRGQPVPPPAEEESDLQARLGERAQRPGEPDWMAVVSQPPAPSPPREEQIDLEARLGGSRPSSRAAVEWEENDWISAAPTAAAKPPAGKAKAPAEAQPLAEVGPLPAGPPRRRRRSRFRRILVILAGGAIIIAIVTVAAFLIRQQLGLDTTLPFTGPTPPPATVEPTRVLIVAPGSATPVPTFTPSPTWTPPPSATPTPTRLPLQSYKLAYSALGRQEKDENLYTIWASGDDDTLTPLTAEGANETWPAVSPDGNRIAFVADQPGNPELYVMSAEGGDATQLTTLGAENLESPSWSPDGTRVVFNADPDGNDEIYVINLETQELVQLTDNASTDREPAWSPDGKTIAFASDRTGRGYLQIFTLPADCNTFSSGCETYVFRLTQSQNSSMSPAWSPDGAQIAFVSNRVSADDQDIYVMRSDGTDPRLLTLEQYGDHGAADLSPSWSADGRWIAFASDRDGTGFQIHVMSLDGTEVFQVTSQPGSALHPSWFP